MKTVQCALCGQEKRITQAEQYLHHNQWYYVCHQCQITLVRQALERKERNDEN